MLFKDCHAPGSPNVPTGKRNQCERPRPFQFRSIVPISHPKKYSGSIENQGGYQTKPLPPMGIGGRGVQLTYLVGEIEHRLQNRF